MDEPGDESMDDSRLDEVESPWDDVTKVSYEFLKTGKSTGLGVLLTHDNNYKVLTSWLCM